MQHGLTSYARCGLGAKAGCKVVEGEGFEPSKAEPTDLQSAPFDRSGTPPKSESRIVTALRGGCQLPSGSFCEMTL